MHTTGRSEDGGWVTGPPVAYGNSIAGLIEDAVEHSEPRPTPNTDNPRPRSFPLPTHGLSEGAQRLPPH